MTPTRKPYVRSSTSLRNAVEERSRREAEGATAWSGGWDEGQALAAAAPWASEASTAAREAAALEAMELAARAGYEA